MTLNKDTELNIVYRHDNNRTFMNQSDFGIK